MKLAVLFDNFGPYHIARLTAASRSMDVLGIEVAARSFEYGWTPADAGDGFVRERVASEGDSSEIDHRTLANRLAKILSDFKPDAVAIPGWSSRAASVALRWSKRNSVPVVLMSESQARDAARVAIKEWFKRRYVRACNTALVGGEPHRDYLRHLGMPEQRIFLGYDAVDNEHFFQGAEAARGQAEALRRKLELPAHYFLASSRFIPKKNLSFLVRAYARYRQACACNAACDEVHRAERAGTAAGTACKVQHVERDEKNWGLVILGDGPLRGEIDSLIAELSLKGQVALPGFRQYGELPVYYGLAGAFIHASTTEQWGLVVNEAMAAGLPVLVSNRCGCAPDLVHEGRNGFVFDPYDVEALAALMVRMSSGRADLAAMGQSSCEIAAAWGPERFAAGLRQAAETALCTSSSKLNVLDALLLRAPLWH